MLKSSKSRGFTLLELLIAISVFSAAIMLIVSAFGLSTKNQRQVRVNRDLSQSVRYVSSEIASQVELSLNKTIISRQGEVLEKNGEAAYNFDIFQRDTRDTLYIHGGDDYCRCYTLENSRVVLYIDKNKGCRDPKYLGPYYLTDPNVDVVKLDFKGIANTASANEQPYVWITIESRTSNLTDFVIPLQTKTLATIRNQGNETK